MLSESFFSQSQILNVYYFYDTGRNLWCPEAGNVVLGIELGSTRIKAIAVAAMGFPVSVLETAGEGGRAYKLSGSHYCRLLACTTKQALW